MTTDRPTIEERYAGAIQSSHMEVTGHRSAVDYVMAAGMVRERLGTVLLRLRTEWDHARHAQRRHNLALHAMRSRCVELEHLDRESPELRALRRLIEVRARIARGRLLSTMVSLPVVRRALEQFAAHQAEVIGGSVPDVPSVVGRAIDVWIDRTCEHCDGRGFNGMAPRVWCTICRGTGRRHAHFGKTRPERRLGDRLLAAMDSKVDRAEQRMIRFLRG